jgi:hypothetical protein
MFGPSAGPSLAFLARSQRPDEVTGGRRPDGNALVVVAADGPPERLAVAILDDQRGQDLSLRLVAVPRSRPLDWSALAFADATSLDGLAFADFVVDPGPPGRNALDAARLAELLARLRSAGLVADGWVSQAVGVLGAVRDGSRHLHRCRSVTLLLGPRRLRPPKALVRLAARPALGRGVAPWALRTRRATG